MSTSPHPALDIPILETGRLTLRGHRLQDFPASAAMWADPNVTRHIMGKPCSEEESWSRMLRYLGHWSLAGYGYWLVEEKATGRFVGEVGFADYKR
jgi:RimJ/RimL family protein N-acetyltransferase